MRPLYPEHDTQTYARSTAASANVVSPNPETISQLCAPPPETVVLASNCARNQPRDLTLSLASTRATF